MTLTLTDMFCGAGGSSTGALSVPGVEVRTAMNHWARAIETHAANHESTDHVCADIQQVDPDYIAPTDILWASPECFTAGHLVTTTRGQVPIEDVQVGDVALTHKNRWRPVVRVQRRNNAKVVRVSGAGHPGITVTPNHRFWARSSDRAWNGNGYTRRYGVEDWMRVDRMLTNEALWATPATIGRSFTIPSEPLPPVFEQSGMGEWLLGRWLGDGSLSFGRNHEVTICCGFHEADKLAADLETTNVRWHRSDKRTATVFTASCAESRDWLERNCGHGAENKQVPAWYYDMPEGDRHALLDGYMSADGGTTQRRHRASTVSRGLAVSMRLIAESLGHRVAMAHDNRTTYEIEGRTGTARQQWIMHWEPKLSDDRRPEAFVENGHAWSRVRRVEELADAATVYNIEVEEDHSYVLDGIVVANCTNHSVAKGRRRVTGQRPLFGGTDEDAAAIKSRATMWDVPRFAEIHNYRLIITENVVDAARWVMFDAWLHAMESLGYEHHIVYINSMHAQLAGLPAPQSRDRMYVMFWKRGQRRPDFDRLRPMAYCPTCDETVRAMQVFKKAERWGRYRAQYVYRCPNTSCRNQVVEPGWLPAASAIDWSLPAQRIGDRAKPLAEKTMARIQAGLDKYGRQAMQVAAAGNTYDAASGKPGSYYRVWPAAEALRTQTGTAEHGLLVPVEGRVGKDARSSMEAMRTQTTRNETGVLIPPLLVRHNNVRGDGGYLSTSVDEVMRTLTTAGHQSLLMPYYGSSKPQQVTDPIGTLTTVDRYAMITLRGQNAPKSPRDALDTFAANGQHHGIASVDVPRVEDCLFRMLSPGEIAAGMAFPGDYIMTGTKREKVKQAGNAVCPPNARDLITIGAESLN
ncbi:DNA cytosine methyltransferase [Zhihengliuella halotolerans]|uniref:DNA cytosine methyltransferase n=1 Tax=Zhihengliuella halotolerans TaxID=370736 RepID=UPI000C803ADD|nr:DNA cytosine methyltransferase [Zhihengliuella halotolerans]